MKKLIIVAVFLCLGFSINAQQLDFPTAEGHGKYTVGGRGGSDMQNNNMADSSIKSGIIDTQ
jgi:pectate lyase